MRKPLDSGKSAGGSRTEAPPIERQALAADISAMAFRTIDPDQSLNLDQELGGDEIVSIFDRLCTMYAVDHDAFWAQIEFQRYFFGEIVGCFPITFAVAWLRRLVRGRRGSRSDGEEPFTIDDLVRIMKAAKRGDD